MERITELNGYKFSELTPAPIKKFSDLSRISAAEGTVLFKNKNNLLPLDKKHKISVFGRTQIDYYKSGTGLGGSIVTKYVANFIDGFRNKGFVINEELVSVYEDWIKDNPFDVGHGWATEPLYQEEMPLNNDILKQAREFSDTAVVIIGRLSGESRDLNDKKGGYYLADCEEQMLKSVCSVFDKVCVVMNIGNILDLTFADKYGVDALVIAWQGGMEGGNACADVLCGDIPACGKLADTVLKDYTDYVTSKDFLSGDLNIFYNEDIYVGYRYFETFAKDKVLYPFGFGLTYTTFDISNVNIKSDDETIYVNATVTNTGNYDGKEVVQLYYEAPQGMLGNPARQLCGFIKTSLLKPGDSETVCMSFDINDMASFDDSGITGNRFCYVLEEGNYNLYLGTDVRTATKVYTHSISQKIVIEKLETALSPVMPFKRIKPKADGNGGYMVDYEEVPQRTYNYTERVNTQNIKALEYTGDRGIKLFDVKLAKNTMDEFIAQLSDEDLTHIVKGEGMNSPKTVPGTTGTLGGVTKSLEKFGIPILNLSDGPSGIRMLTGATATSMPCGTQLACTWNKELIDCLYQYEGIELRSHQMDVLLGPGMNIHRDPLNGRNFEYLSEDPYLTGVLSAAMVNAIQKSGCDATIKHFFANNRETDRYNCQSILSERAAREIYLKGFEIAVKSGAKTIMTTYNAVNGIWNAGNYDLNTVVLREQWDFDGLVMTDWWSQINDENEEPSKTNLCTMVKAQNDCYMVVSDSVKYNDNLCERLKTDNILRAALQRSASNICKFLMNSSAMDRFEDNGFRTIGAIPENLDEYSVICSHKNIQTDDVIHITSDDYKTAYLKVTYSSDKEEIVQNQIKIYTPSVKGAASSVVQVPGTNGQTRVVMGIISLKEGDNEMKFTKDNDEIHIHRIDFLG